MKANELMLSSKSFMADDWVNTPDGNGIIRLINAIDEKFVVRVMGMDCWFLPNVISPIPLTGEILDKNFSADKQWGESGWFINDHIHIYRESFGVYHIQYMELVEIQYVHELQHALKLCGIDKNIKL